MMAENKKAYSLYIYTTFEQIIGAKCDTLHGFL